MALGVLIVLVAGLALYRARKRTVPTRSEWVQLTNFTDSATSPALSPDGRMLAFIRGTQTFFGPGQVYVKLLPNGDPAQLTHDVLPKMSPLFSPDGSRIAYTVPWDTWVVPVMGGEAHRMLPNASGLTWIEEHRLLFSEVKKGIHMAIVTSAESRAESRDIYVPPHERGMAHRSYLSPDGKWVLLAEMDNGGWLPCRVVPYVGSSAGRQVGPSGAQCTSAAWSPDGKWIYLESNAGGTFHVWRQPFPEGEPEQITSGPTEEEGIAMAPDGRSIITSVGIVQSAVWVHDAIGDRQVSSEGFAFLGGTGSPFSPDGRKLYYLVRRGTSRAFEFGELWVADLDSSRTERLLPGFSITNYDISPDGKRVVFAAVDAKEKSSLWLASLDRRFPPRQLTAPADVDNPTFDLAGNLFYRAAEGNANFIYRMKEDGSGREKAVRDPIIFFGGISPDSQWAEAFVAVSGEEKSWAMAVYPISGGPSVPVCDWCGARWARHGKSIYVWFPPRGAGGTHRTDKRQTQGTFVIPLRNSQAFADLAAHGIISEARLGSLPNVNVIDHVNVSPGPSPSLYAFTQQTVHRNLYRIPVP